VSIRTQALRIIVLGSLILSVAVFAAPPAQAMDGGAVCVEGTFDGTNCVIVGQPPTAGGLECPISDTVVEADGDCYTPVEPVLFCVGLAITVEDPADCVDIVPVDPGPLACTDGFELTDESECIRTEAAAATCSAGVLVNQTCVETAALETELVCPDEPGVQFVEGACFSVAAPIAGPCPSGATDVDGVCQALVEGEPGGFGCEVTSDQLSGSDCLRNTPLDLFCEVGDQLGELCIQNLGPALPVDLEPGVFECPAVPAGLLLVDGDCIDVLDNRPVCVNGGFIDEFGEFCVTTTPAIELPPLCPDALPTADGLCEVIVPREADVCPETATLDPTTAECRLAVELTQVTTCPAGFTLSEVDCERISAPDLLCATGSLADGQCLIIGEIVQLPGTCPPDATSTGDGLCEVPAVPDQECPLDAPADDAGVCRLPVPLVPTDSECSAGFELVDGQCITFAPPAYFCAGLEVTINMRAGDRGRGTAGNDVILGTDGRDVIRGNGGDDVICAGGGNDYINGGRGNDTIYAGSGNDYVNGSSGSDTIFGEAGYDWVRGGSGDDTVDGGAGHDWVQGDRGNDILSGGADHDWCLGNRGSDTADDTCEVAIRAW